MRAAACLISSSVQESRGTPSDRRNPVRASETVHNGVAFSQEIAKNLYNDAKFRGRRFAEAFKSNYDSDNNPSDIWVNEYKAYRKHKSLNNDKHFRI